MTEVQKLCADCGAPMVRRTNRHDGSEFLGCSGYRTSGCSYTEELPEYFRLKAQGAPTLPGLEADE